MLFDNSIADRAVGVMAPPKFGVEKGTTISSNVF